MMIDNTRAGVAREHEQREGDHAHGHCGDGKPFDLKHQHDAERQPCRNGQYQVPADGVAEGFVAWNASRFRKARHHGESAGDQAKGIGIDGQIRNGPCQLERSGEHESSRDGPRRHGKMHQCRVQR